MPRNGSVPDWIPGVVEVQRRRAPATDPPARLEKRAHSFGWIWKALATIGSCLAAGAAGHAAVETWGARFQSAANAALVGQAQNERLKALEDWRASETLTVHDACRDIQDVRRDLAEHKATAEDSGLRPRRR